MLKLTIKDVLKQKPFGMIGIISGISLGILYYFLTLEMALTHMATEMELLPMYMDSINYVDSNCSSVSRN